MGDRINLRTLSTVALGIALTLLASSCRTTGTKSEALEERTTIPADALKYVEDKSKATIEPFPKKGLTTRYRRQRAFPGRCGYELSTVKPFRARGDRAFQKIWFDEGPAINRPVARPTTSECKAFETMDRAHPWCWQKYRLQFYPTSSLGADHYRVAGTSPIIRMIKRQSMPPPATSCMFENPSALIVVLGVQNPELGLSWSLTDPTLLASTLAWAQNHNPKTPRSLDIKKLNQVPGYIQLVGNSLGRLAGMHGFHDEQAIEKLIRNIQLAYISGVENLEIVTHSNGMVTAHIALTEFAKRFKNNLLPWTKERDRVESMSITVFHLQAAPSQKWSFSELDKFGSTSDFLPNAEWVRKKKGIFSYWGWDWNFDTHQTLAVHFDLKLAYFYNRPDWMTYDHNHYSSVGRNESLAWLQEVKKNGSNRGAKVAISHQSCQDASPRICGPGHKQEEVLWHFSNPNMHGSGKPMPWKIDGIFNPKGLNLAASDSDFLDELPQYAELICVDHESVDTSICEPAKSIDSYLQIPKSVCMAKGEESPCTNSTCGDRICGFDEKATCPTDCALPPNSAICVCEKRECRVETLSCTGIRCQLDTQAAKICACQDNVQIHCSRFDDLCVIKSTAESGCEKLTLRERSDGHLVQEQCLEDTCTDNAAESALIEGAFRPPEFDPIGFGD